MCEQKLYIFWKLLSMYWHYKHNAKMSAVKLKYVHMLICLTEIVMLCIKCKFKSNIKRIIWTHRVTKTTKRSIDGTYCRRNLSVKCKLFSAKLSFLKWTEKTALYPDSQTNFCVVLIYETCVRTSFCWSCDNIFCCSFVLSFFITVRSENLIHCHFSVNSIFPSFW